jgi:zinc D-Ala-D-Ala dipeptidase
MSDMPRFDQPDYTIPARDHFAGALPSVPPQPPLPPLIEPDPPTVSDPIDEPLVRVAHRRIRTLDNYWHAGWSHAIPGTFLRNEVNRRLGAVADSLPDRWGLAVFDAWRPIELQRELYDTAYADPDMEPGFMAPVSHDPSTPPPHLTGGAVDLTLTHDGTPLAAGCGFDDTTKQAHTAILENTPGVEREIRRMLCRVMRRQDFVVIDCEWWHFEYGTRRWAAIREKPPFYGPAPAPGVSP